jgi:hypothetical protein
VRIRTTLKVLALLISAALFAGCGLLYQAHTRIRTERMLNSLQPGVTSLDVHEQWGEPDMRTDMGNHTQVWSYAVTPNTDDPAAALLYTAPKEGDKGRFLDLKFVDGKLASWAEAEHRMPPKAGSGLTYGLGGPPVSNPMHY